jgi:cytochrome c oxidase subunit III
MTHRIVGDLSGLPEHAFGHRTLIWWGVLGFILIEGTAFVLAGGSYLFLMGHTDPWPPARLAPSLVWGTLFTVLMLASALPNVWTNKRAHAEDRDGVRVGLLIMSALGVVLLIVRGFELAHLNVRWDANAYGSIVWALIFLHLVHLLTDLADTLILTVFTFTHEVDGNRFSDVADNCLYWHFVVFTWLPIYGLVYWAPRLVQ